VDSCDFNSYCQFNCNDEGAIVDAAQAITGILVQHAYGAQRDRLEKRRQPGQRYRNDLTWANGHISASHGVAPTEGCYYVNVLR